MPCGNIPDLRPEPKTIQLADGSSSKQDMGSVSIWCQAGNSGNEKLDFYVMGAPSNLLGRYVIKWLWPEVFKGLREVASIPTVKKIMEVTEVPGVVSKTEAKATKVLEGNVVPVPMKRTIFTEPVNHCTDTDAVPVKDTTVKTPAVASRRIIVFQLTPMRSM